MRVTSLGSGSKGNATLLEAGDTRILIDCGFSAAELTRRLARRGLHPAQMSALLITHEHGDHCRGAAVLSRRHGLTVWLTRGSHAAQPDPDFAAVRHISPHRPFILGEVQVNPFPVPHDAREPCQFVFEHTGRRLGLLTDLGSVTPHVLRQLAGCHALLLECNHDRDMLRSGPYPPALQRRVGGDYGHLANDQSRALLERLDQTALRWLVGMHLSEKNNRPDLAIAALEAGLRSARCEVVLAGQGDGFDWRQV